jgi:genome maintenance exonuclease 1|tara:strand:+ start:1989 stop:2648 length:660 start_codon:yes stop_codon:yes gene_type:complete
MFNHVIMEMSLEDICARNVGGKRVYEVGDQKYPSISTICSFRNRKSIAEWRARVGAEEANKISKRATTAGTTVHSMIEDYLNNELDLEKYDGKHLAKILFTQAKPMLARINNIHFQEAPLYSHEFAIAGRVDCIAEFDGKLSIIDFKTSSKEKKEEWIEGYLVQETGYAKMYEERSGIKVEQIVTLITCQTGDTQVFIKNPDDYVPLLRDYIQEYNDAQ